MDDTSKKTVSKSDSENNRNSRKKTKQQTLATALRRNLLRRKAIPEKEKPGSKSQP